MNSGLPGAIIDLYHGDTLTDSGFHDLVGAGVAAVILKASQGTGADHLFEQRRERALTVGLKVGSYHFGVGGDPEAQAEFYLDTVGNQTAQLYCLDWETNPKGDSMELAEAEVFARHVQAHTGRWPLFYVNASMGATVPATSCLRHCPLWLARYSVNPGKVPSAWHDWTLWQHTDTGAVAGVVGAVDRSCYNGMLATLKARWPNL